jgi:hypothetical protein
MSSGTTATRIAELTGAGLLRGRECYLTTTLTPPSGDQVM